MAGQDGDKKKKTDPKLVGETSEVTVMINNKETSALCDTGSCVSTCSEQYYKENLKNTPLKPINNILKIECADGNTLQYKGYVKVTLRTQGIPKSVEQNVYY